MVVAATPSSATFSTCASPSFFDLKKIIGLCAAIQFHVNDNIHVLTHNMTIPMHMKLKSCVRYANLVVDFILRPQNKNVRSVKRIADICMTQVLVYVKFLPC